MKYCPLQDIDECSVLDKSGLLEIITINKMSPIAYQSRYMDLESQFTHPVSQKKLLFGSLPLLHLACSLGV